MRKIIIETVDLVPSKDGLGTRLSFSVTTKAGTAALWFQVENEFSEYLTTDRVDAALVAILPMVVGSL